VSSSVDTSTQTYLTLLFNKDVFLLAAGKQLKVYSLFENLKKSMNAVVKAAKFIVQIRMVMVVVVGVWCPTCQLVPSWCA
jgi:hypothetical protein